ncbi:MAG: hypothetical protein KA214_06360 [Neisseriaceae bacterium]|nr:hypothetical protein [Neisseriaceae bacterium]
MLSFLTIKGDHFDVGEALGRFGAAAFRRFQQESPAWSRLLAWLPSPKLQQMAALVETHYPAYWQELQGLAQGLDVPFEQVLLWNCRGDLWALSPDGCTSIQTAGVDFSLAHNEDGDPLFRDHCGLAHVCVGDEEYVSFFYPGSLLGHTFATNRHGLAITVNNLRLQNEDVGMPRMVLTRAALAASSAQEVMALLQRHPRAGGFHLTVAELASQEMYGIEFGPYDCSQQRVRDASLHANHMIHEAMRPYPQLITGSSAFRQLVGDQLLAQGLTPLAILRHQGHPHYPIYRDGASDSDNENTLATVHFVANGQSWDWAVYEAAETPTFRFRNCQQL